MIPVSEPQLIGRELEYVTRCLQTGWISSSGTFVQRFEEEWSRSCGRKYGVSVCNGTAALELALVALELREGDEIIMPTFTIISCAAAILYSGATPVLVDVNPRTWTMDVTQVAKKISSRTKAIMVVHIYGHPVDMDPIITLAEQNGLVIIEDAAEAHGAEYLSGRTGMNPQWKRCGSFGIASCFSFYSNKPITTGEGGMVLTDDPKLADRLCSLRNLCFRPERRFSHQDLGFNFRITNLQAAIGLAQCERFAGIVAKKRWIGQEYSKRLEGIPGLQLPVEESWAKSIYWMYGVVLRDEVGIDAHDFSKMLSDSGVETRPFFLGMHEQPVFKNRNLFKGERYPVAEQLAMRGLYLPSGMALTENQLGEVVGAVRSALHQ